MTWFRLVSYNRNDNSLSQSWNLSLVGDWNSVTTNGTAQTHTHGPTHELLTGAGFDNRMSTADVGNDNSIDVTYKWDALGRRVYRDDSTTTEIYFQAGQQTIADYVVGAAAASPKYNYVYASYIDEPVLREEPATSTKLYFHHNQQYSLIGITDASGASNERYVYSAYGTPIFLDSAGITRPTSNFSIRHTYTGRERDSSLSLYHYRARMYDSVAGRFCSRDPIGYEDGMSLYCGYFVPMDTDFSGMKTCKCICRKTTGGGLGGTTGPSHQNLNGVPDNVSCETACESKSYRRWGLGGGSVRTCKADPRFTPGIKICSRFVLEGTPCEDVINSCGGQHTYIQFGAVAPDGNALPGTTGIGFSGPGLTPPAPETSFHPTSCNDVSIPKGMTYGAAVACILAHAPTKPYTELRDTPNPFSWYMCGHWASEAIETCGLSSQSLF